ncbi:glycosyltransferase family 4 protein [Jeotgalicoccus halotolerans]|uniref:Glycosyltransferase involved in cell wall biosynthesis n=1 Tax=Jeotgalicoccus halotolerans TaxID=157227 RepID=A0A3E0B1N0_9STAP|nr:glycosyltransferase family 4 protein [Jeotgalicoccus halotolerans]REG25865.1 glycosyltransferase involved in cell wall biosynthesis [Jeotgalicoccus halotolerans]
MNLLFIVHFHAPMGGLHENVYSSALYMKKQGCEVYVLLKPGPLEERLRAQGIHTILAEFGAGVTAVKTCIEQLENMNVKFDLIHFHPGLSKYPALKYGWENDIPLVETYHGMWHDDLNKHAGKLDAIVTVSEGIKLNLQSRLKRLHDRYYVIPNGYDSSLFTEPVYHDKNKKELNVGFVTRLDDDKQFIMDILLLAVNHLKKKQDIKINIHMIGDGTQKEEFMRLSEEMLSDTGHSIIFKGWLTDKNLRDAYLECDLIIAPGRSAIEGMASGKPVIAAGSKNYIGLIKHDNWQFGIYNNFGGTGFKFAVYELGSVERDLDYLIDNRERIRPLGEFSYKIASQFFDADKLNQKLLNLYEILVLGKQVEVNK